MTYIQYFIEDYDPEAKEQYQKELANFMEKLKESE
jgi:hypothetical protein